VCTDCFEISGNNKSKVPRLLASKCLEKTRHKCVTVRVRKVDGVLEPEIRPVPWAHFKGEFVLCDPEKCRWLKKGGTCNFPHCFKEKAAWNAEKFGVSASLSPVTKTLPATPIKIGSNSSIKDAPPKVRAQSIVYIQMVCVIGKGKGIFLLSVCLFVCRRPFWHYRL
jgi:hypothetical protein